MKKPRFWYKQRVAFHNAREATPVRVVADAAIHTPGVVGGRFVPVLIIDTTDRPDIEEYVRVHQNYGPGDVITTWGMDLKSKDLALRLDIKRPLEIIILLTFNPEKSVALVSQILSVGALWLQPGRPGDRFSHDITRGRVLMEVPDTGFKAHWEKERRKIITKKFRKFGMDRRRALAATEEYFAQMKLLEDFADR